MRTMTIAPPFSFTKGAPLMRIDVLPLPWERPGGKDTAGPGTRLYDLEKDPAQLQPIQDKDAEDRMIRLMVKLMKENDAPAEQFERMGLS
jgi:hypothetical protein